MRIFIFDHAKVTLLKKILDIKKCLLKAIKKLEIKIFDKIYSF